MALMMIPMRWIVKRNNERFNGIKEDIENAYCLLTAYHLAWLLIRRLAPDSGIQPRQLCEAMGWAETDTFVFDFEGK